MNGPWFTEALAAERMADLRRDGARSARRVPRRRQTGPVATARVGGWLRTPAVTGCGA